MRMHSERRRFVGMNVRGTPAMSGAKVAHDLVAGQAASDVLALQEFKWRWYWLKARRVLQRAGWGTYPSVLVGLARPVFAGQAIAWDKSVWKARRRQRLVLHAGAAKISEARQLRAVLLEDRTSGLACWFGTTHFVVGGDQEKDSPTRRAIMLTDLVQLEAFLSKLQESGHPGAFQLDANLSPASHVWPAFQRLLRRRECLIHGVRGVEYLITWQGRWTPGRDLRGRPAPNGIVVESDFIIPKSKLETDHEARGIRFRLSTEDTP